MSWRAGILAGALQAELIAARRDRNLSRNHLGPDRHPFDDSTAKSQ
jgi:hypothetical protein